MRSEVLTAVKMSMLGLSPETLKMETVCFFETLVSIYLPTSPHGVTTQNNNIDIFTAVRTSHLVISLIISV
jgi:hypothetical protein